MSQKYPEWYELPAERWRNSPNSFCERDSQRQKLYDAQFFARCSCNSLCEDFSSLRKIQEFVDSLIVSIWFRKRFGYQPLIIVKSKRGYGADTHRGSSTIRFSKSWRNMLTVLHEVAHIVRKPGTGSNHGRFFARTLLELVNHVVGEEAAKILKKEFKSGRVKYLPKRELSEETREKLRQGFINRILKQKILR